jgi:hypothetical protein
MLSMLPVLMFLIYINDIGEKLISLSRLFADDTSRGYSSQSVDQIKIVINHDLLELNACPDFTSVFKKGANVD